MFFYACLQNNTAIINTNEMENAGQSEDSPAVASKTGRSASTAIFSSTHVS